MQKGLAEVLMTLQCIAMKNVVNHLMNQVIYYKRVDVGFSLTLCLWYSFITDSPELARQRGDPDPEPQCPI